MVQGSQLAEPAARQTVPLHVNNRPPGVAAAKYQLCRRVLGTAGPKMSSPARLPSPELPTDPCSAAASMRRPNALLMPAGRPGSPQTPTRRCRVHISRPHPPCRRRHARLPVATPHNEGIPQLTAGCILHGRPPTVLAPLDNVPPTGSPPQSKLPVGPVDLSQSGAKSHGESK